jgi:hypothetical protein
MPAIISKLVLPIVIALLVATGTWYVKDWLDRARVDARLLDVAIKAETTGLFNIFNLGAISEFFPQDIRLDVERFVIELPTPGDDASTLLRSINLLQDKTKEQISLEVSLVRDALQAAKSVLPRLEAAVSELSTFNRRGSPTDEKQCMDVVKDVLDRNKVDQYVPFSPEQAPAAIPVASVSETWCGHATASEDALRTALDVIRSPIPEIEKELVEETERINQSELIEFSFLISNHGNQAVAIFPYAVVKPSTRAGLKPAQLYRVLEDGSAAEDPLILQSDTSQLIRFRTKRMKEDSNVGTLLSLMNTDLNAVAEFVFMDSQDAVVRFESVPIYTGIQRRDQIFERMLR